jgi:hypothetical protein
MRPTARLFTCSPSASIVRPLVNCRSSTDVVRNDRMRHSYALLHTGNVNVEEAASRELRVCPIGKFPDSYGEPRRKFDMVSHVCCYQKNPVPGTEHPLSEARKSPQLAEKFQCGSQSCCAALRRLSLRPNCPTPALKSTRQTATAESGPVAAPPRGRGCRRSRRLRSQFPSLPSQNAPPVRMPSPIATPDLRPMCERPPDPVARASRNPG